MEKGQSTIDDQSLVPLALITFAEQYLTLVENVCRETVNQGNNWVVCSNGNAIDNGRWEEDYTERTKWSDHSIILPLLFNLFHGMELLLKGLLKVDPECDVKAVHGLARLHSEFRKIYPNDCELYDVIGKYTAVSQAPKVLRDFMSENNFDSMDEFYQAVRYPCDTSCKKVRWYKPLKYKGEDGAKFFEELADDVKAARRLSVQLWRRVCPVK